jgi:hypothetical protein
MNHKTIETTLVGLAMAGVFLIFAWPLLGNAARLNVFPDNEWLVGSTLASASGSIRAGDWPLRTDNVMGGLPLYNLPQVSAWYPLYLLPFDLYATPTATMSTLHAITLLHLALFTGNAWLLMRTLRMEPVAAFFGTLFVVFNTATLGVMNWANLFASYSWLPLYLAGAVRLLECRRGFRGTALTCVGLAMLAYAMVGQPLVMAAALTIILLSAYAASRWQAGDRLGAAEGPARLTMALVAAACLTAPVVLPVLCDLGSMIRWVGPTTAIRANEQMPFECYVTDQMTSEELPSFVVPWHATHVHAIAQPYVGAFPLLLAALGLACSPARHWLARPLVIVAVYSFLSCFGDTFGLARINFPAAAQSGGWHPRRLGRRMAVDHFTGYPRRRPLAGSAADRRRHPRGRFCGAGGGCALA